MIDFNMIQKSLIAFQNDDQDEIFNYYDQRNKNRTGKLGNKGRRTQDITGNIKEQAV